MRPSYAPICLVAVHYVCFPITPQQPQHVHNIYITLNRDPAISKSHYPISFFPESYVVLLLKVPCIYPSCYVSIPFCSARFVDARLGVSCQIFYQSVLIDTFLQLIDLI